ncbi:MAG TPA: glycosyltransferase family 25 protein [Bacteroidales bacterium]|nr:glycosyltransferase family 25 protein [Bacteroidales bacterium]
MKTLIINVSTNVLRKNHMLDLIAKNECLNDYYFIHDGDLDAISDEILTQYFDGELKELSSMVSCAYKHILAYQYVLDNNLEFALILEDDIYLHKGFCVKLNNIVNEVRTRQLSNFIISLEDSILQYVKGSELEKNKLLYKKPLGRTAGAYIIDKMGAQSLLQELYANKCHRPIDWFHNDCSLNELINIYWAHPVIATQGSLNGKIPSLIDKKKTGHFRIIGFRLSQIYKTILYRIR